ncbi:hypothetical protein KFL_000220090 [Klebsormidium nitens]|uniref:Uncharacterized protein n=1 Tax=Klebsormidium nitens TaxID=105231 RepID=A0A1Y1HQY2_KLENI|nr:hypothetical protein KFL_000220090 [Klebsormidium nitens]|eukprot:GAQ78977.1 hypothetical protein KFL_000220090 [Klebsormidium nitens]
MGEAAVLAAFNLEFSKVLKGAPLGARFPNPVARKLAELLEHFTPKLSVPVFAPRLLQLGDLLFKREAFHLARHSCFLPVARRTSILKPANPAQLPLLTCNVQARYGAALCSFQELRCGDPTFQNPKTLKGALTALGEMKAALGDSLLEHEELYWLALNGANTFLLSTLACSAFFKETDVRITLQSTVHIWSSVQPLMAASLASETLEFVVSAIAAMESQVALCAPRHLEWRCQLYLTACEGYCLAEYRDKAKACAERGRSKVRELEELQRLDPVPPLPETVATYDSARRTMQLACFQYGDQSGTVTSESVAQNLAQTFAEPIDRILALALALENPTQRVLGGVPPTSYQRVLLGCANNLLAGILDEIVTSAAAPATPSSESGGASSRGSQNGPADALLPIDLHRRLLHVAFTYGDWPLFDSLAAAADARVTSAPPTAFSAGVKLLRAVRDLQKAEGGGEQDLLAALGIAIGACGAEFVTRDGEILTDAALLLWGEVKHLLEKRDADLTSRTSDVPRSGESVFTPNGSSDTPDGSAAILGGGTSGEEDTRGGKSDETLIELLATLHDVSERLELPDALMHAQIALRLASLLDSRQKHPGTVAENPDARDLERALEVLRGALRAVERFRDLDTEVRAHDDVSDRSWAEAREGGPGDEAQKLLRSCHVDLLMTYCRLRLRLGAHAEAAEAAARLSREESTLRKREQQSSIFGAMTLKEKKEAQDRLTRVGRPPPFSVKAEKELLAECNSNPYQRALVLAQIAATRPSQADRALFLQQAQAELENARVLEESARPLCSGGEGGSSRGVPAPLILTRMSVSVTIRPASAFPARLKSGKNSGGRDSPDGKPVAYAVFGKVAGSGVGVSLHNTDFPGTGAHARAPLSDVITVTGLTPNERYIFALAFYDATGALIDTIGPSTAPVTLALPLPRLQCQAYLALTAHRLGCPKEALFAARPVVAHFVEKVAVDEDGVERLFGDQLRATEAREAPSTLLRSFVQYPPQAVPLEADANFADVTFLFPANQVLFMESEAAPAPLRALNPAQTPHSLLPSQLERLQQAHRLLIAAQAAALCECAPLVYEAATRFYNRVVPLLANLPEKCPVIQPLLAGCHVVLATVNQTAGLTSGAGKVAAGLTSQLFKRLAAIAEGGTMKAIGKMDLGVFTSDGKSVLGVHLHSADGCEKAWAALKGDLAAHPRAFELAVRVIEKEVREGCNERVVKWGGELEDMVRAKGKRPGYVAREKTEQESDSKSKGKGGDSKKLTKKPSAKDDGKRSESRSGSTVQSGEDPVLKEDLSPEQAALDQKRVAAAVTIQKHVLSRLAWSREVRKTREWFARNGAWIARLHIALGLALPDTKPAQTPAPGSGQSSPENEVKRPESNPKVSRPPSASAGAKSKKTKGDVSKSAAVTPAPRRGSPRSSRPSIAEEEETRGTPSENLSNPDAPRGISGGLAKAAYLLASALADVINGSDDAETAAEVLGFGEKVLRALATNRRWTRVLELGMSLTARGATERVLQLMVTSAEALGEAGCRDLGISAGVLRRDLEGIWKQKPPALDALEGCRKQWEEFLRLGRKDGVSDGGSWPLGGDRMAGDASEQKAAVVKAYTKAITLLQAGPDAFLLAQAHSELGDIHAHFGDMTAAGQCWKDALDAVTGAYKSLDKWRQLFRSDLLSGTVLTGIATETSKGALNAEPLGNPIGNVRSPYGTVARKEGDQRRTRGGDKTAGINEHWMHVLSEGGGAQRCLLGADVISKLLTSALTSDAHAQREAALMAAEMTSAVFATSMAHPQAPLALATYTPEPLSWGHVAPFAVGHVGSVNRLQRALFTLATHLVAVEEEPLRALPVLALLRGALGAAKPNPLARNAATLLHVEALLAVGRLSEAFAELQRLFTPVGAPANGDPADAGKANGTGKDGKSKPVAPEAVPAPKQELLYANNLPPSHPSNQAAIAFLANADVAGNVSTELELARARFLCRVGSLWATGMTDGPGLSTEASLNVPRPKSGNNTKKTAESGKTSRASVTVAANQEVTSGSACLAQAEALLRKALDAAAQRWGVEPEGGNGGVDGAAAGQGLDGLEVLARGGLVLSDVLRAQHRPKAALNALETALNRISKAFPPQPMGDGHGGVNVPLRHAVLQKCWLECQLRLAEILLDLGHFTLARAASEQLESQAGSAGSVNYTLRAQSLLAELDVLAGAVRKGFEGLSAVAAQCREHHYSDGLFLPTQLLRLAELARAEKLDTRNGLVLCAEACALLECQEVELGANDVQKKEALRSVYLPTTETLAVGLLLRGTALLGDQSQVSAALASLVKCERLLSHVVANPPAALVSRAHIALARAFIRSNETKKATDKLRTAIRTIVQTGAHDRALLQEAFQLLAAAAAGLDSPDGAIAAALQNARAVADMATFLESELCLNLPNPDAVPAHALEIVRAGEEYRITTRNVLESEASPGTGGKETGQASPPAASPLGRRQSDVSGVESRDLGPLLLAHYRALVREQQRLHVDVRMARETGARARELHRFLLASCVQYAEKCCFKTVPDFDAAAQVTPGLVACAWVQGLRENKQADGAGSTKTGPGSEDSLSVVYLVVPSDGGATVIGISAVENLDYLSALRFEVKQMVAKGGDLIGARSSPPETDPKDAAKLFRSFCRTVWGVEVSANSVGEIGNGSKEVDDLTLAAAIDRFLDFRRGFCDVSKALADFLVRGLRARSHLDV